MAAQSKWFGREPALVIQGVAAVLAALVAFGLPGLSDQLAAALVAVLTAGAAAWTAIHVQPIAPSVFGAVLSASAGLLGVLHLYDISQQQLGTAQVALAALVAMWSRGQQEPLDTPR